MSDNVLVFCSNPVNGGTALVMAQTVIGLSKDSSFRVFPVVNSGNNVEAYKALPDITYLDVLSEEQVFGECPQNIGLLKRIKRRIIRNIKYRPIIKQNIKKFEAYCRDNSIDSVLIHNGGYVGDDLCNQLLKAASRVVMKHRILVLHNDFCKTKVGMVRYALYDKRISKWATELVTVSNFTRNRILKNSFISKDMKVIYNGLQEKQTLTEQEKSEKLRLGKDACNIGMIGNFQSNKGHFYLLSAFKLLKENCNQKVVLSIIGNIYENDFYCKCTDYIKQNNLSEFINIYHDIYKAGEYCNQFDFMVVPSLWDESFGLTACEAMMAGRACVVTQTGGLPEVITGSEDGFVVPIDDVELFAKKLNELVCNKDLRIKMGQSARKHYEEKFTIEKMIKQYSEILL
mgnify:CR=1 FL=1